jgi:hypothetical protein
MLTINLVSTKKCKMAHDYPSSMRECRKCRLAYAKKYREENKESAVASVKKWHAANKEKMKAYHKEYYETHREGLLEQQRKYNKTRVAQTFAKDLRKNFDLTIEDYARMLHAQDRKCAACGDALAMNKKTHVDHCHATGKVRAILCHHCNISLGLMQESPDRMRSLIAYIERFK